MKPLGVLFALALVMGIAPARATPYVYRAVGTATGAVELDADGATFGTLWMSLELYGTPGYGPLVGSATIQVDGGPSVQLRALIG